MPLDWLNYLDSDLFTRKDDEFMRYIQSLYYSILGLNLNELGPQNGIEYGFCICHLIISLMIQNILVSEIIILITQNIRKKLNFQDKVDNVTTVMDYIEI